MRLSYQIVREKFAASAFTGEGAALTGGRWNSPGTRVVYTRASASLAALETLVHLNPAMRFNYLLNTSHPDFKSIILGKPQPFAFDHRLIP